MTRKNDIEIEIVDRVEKQIEIKVYEEIERWKGIHEAENARKKRATWMSAVATVVVVLGLSFPTIDIIATKVAEKTITDNQAPYLALLNNMVNQVANTASLAESEAEKAQSAAEQAKVSASRALSEVDSTLNERITEITDSTKDGAIKILIDRAVNSKFDNALLTGSASIGKHAHNKGEKIFQVSFPRTMRSIPKVFLSFRHPGGTNHNDSFAFAVRNINTGGFELVVTRAPNIGWGMNLQLDWLALTI